MRKILAFLLCLVAGAVHAAEDKPIAELSTGDAIILGVVEGVTEFLPVSSTGHLVVANHLLKLDSEAPLLDAAGRPIWFKPPSAKHPDGEILTEKIAADTYTVIIQFGAIAAVALLFWRDLLAMVRGIFGKDPAGLRLVINVMVAFLPAAVIGLLLSKWIDKHLFSVPAVIFAQVAGALFMFWAEAWRRKQTRKFDLAPADMSPKGALGIGFLQCLALWPGTSRSMTTIVGGYFNGLNPKRAAEFSFVLGLVTLTAATAYKSYSGGAAMIRVFGWSNILLGCLVAAVSAAIAVKFFVGYLSKHGLALFGWWRLVFAAFLTVVYFL